MTLVPENKKKQTAMERAQEYGLTPYGLAPWSHSKLKLLKKCPLNFYLQYILKMKPTVEPEISLVTEVGKAAHLILEYTLKGKTIKESFKLARKEFAETITDEQWVSEVETLEYNITEFKERIETFDKKFNIKRFHQEIRIGVDHNWEPTGFFADDVYFRGVIDLVIQLANGDVIYIDHKTGASALAGIKNFMDQLNTYKVLFHFGIEKTAGAQSGIHYIRDGQLLLSDYVEVADIEKSLKDRLEFSIQGNIDYVKELGYFKHIAGPHCNWCAFKTDCKAKKLVPLEKESKKWFEIKEIKE